jgi:hypothetical protein
MFVSADGVANLFHHPEAVTSAPSPTINAVPSESEIGNRNFILHLGSIPPQ